MRRCFQTDSIKIPCFSWSLSPKSLVPPGRTLRSHWWLKRWLLLHCVGNLINVLTSPLCCPTPLCFDSLLDKRTVDCCCFCSLVIIIDASVSIAFTFCMTSHDALFTNKTPFRVRRELITLDFSSSEEIWETCMTSSQDSCINLGACCLNPSCLFQTEYPDHKDDQKDDCTTNVWVNSLHFLLFSQLDPVSHCFPSPDKTPFIPIISSSSYPP